MEPENTLILTLDTGPVTIKLRPDLAPGHVERIKELARRLEHDAGALTRLLDKMQERGFLQRQSCQEDRRSVEISLTDAGRALSRPLRTVSEQLTEFALSDLSDTEKSTLMALLRRVRTTLEK